MSTKPKHTMVAILLLSVGGLLLCGSILQAAMEVARMDIIGGADLPTFLLVFHREHGGIYALLALGGLVCLIAAVVVALRGRKRKR